MQEESELTRKLTEELSQIFEQVYQDSEKAMAKCRQLEEVSEGHMRMVHGAVHVSVEASNLRSQADVCRNVLEEFRQHHLQV